MPTASAVSPRLQEVIDRTPALREKFNRWALDLLAAGYPEDELIEQLEAMHQHRVNPWGPREPRARPPVPPIHNPSGPPKTTAPGDAMDLIADGIADSMLDSNMTNILDAAAPVSTDNAIDAIKGELRKMFEPGAVDTLVMNAANQGITAAGDVLNYLKGALFGGNSTAASAAGAAKPAEAPPANPVKTDKDTGNGDQPALPDPATQPPSLPGHLPQGFGPGPVLAGGEAKGPPVDPTSLPGSSGDFAGKLQILAYLGLGHVFPRSDMEALVANLPDADFAALKSIELKENTVPGAGQTLLNSNVNERQGLVDSLNAVFGRLKDSNAALYAKTIGSRNRQVDATEFNNTGLPSAAINKATLGQTLAQNAGGRPAPTVDPRTQAQIRTGAGGAGLVNPGGGVVATTVKSGQKGDYFNSGPNAVETANQRLREDFQVAGSDLVRPSAAENLQRDLAFETWSWVPDSNADGLGSGNPLKALNQQHDFLRYGPSSNPFPRGFNYAVHEDCPHVPPPGSVSESSDLSGSVIHASVAHFIAQPAVQAHGAKDTLMKSRKTVLGPHDVHSTLSAKGIRELGRRPTQFKSIYGPQRPQRQFIKRPVWPRSASRQLRKPSIHQRRDLMPAHTEA